MIPLIPGSHAGSRRSGADPIGRFVGRFVPIGHRNGACAHSSGPRTGTRGSYLGGIDTRRSFYPIRQCAEAEEVDGEVVDAEAEQRLAAQRAFFDQVRSDEGLLAAAAEELRVEDERRERVSFPRNAAERTTFRQIRAGDSERWALAGGAGSPRHLSRTNGVSG